MNIQRRRLNGWRRLALMPLLLLAVLLLVLAGSLEFPGTAHAQGGTTVTFTITVASTAQLIARTTVQISSTVTCALPEGATFLDAGGGVQITQASGRVIVQAGGFFAPVTCDGTAQTFQVFATPPAGSRLTGTMPWATSTKMGLLPVLKRSAFRGSSDSRRTEVERDRGAREYGRTQGRGLRWH